MSKTDQRDSSGLWELEKQLSIPIWHNYLSLPVTDQDYTVLEIRLQEQHNFVFIRDGRDSIDIFLSEDTNLKSLFQVSPFLSETCSFFLCNDQLIKERLSFLKQKKHDFTDNATTKQLIEMLEIAATKGASDIHLESSLNRKTIRIRVNGKLERITLSREATESLLTKIKLISRLDIAKKRSPQDGHFPYTTSKGKRFDLRVSTLPTIFGEKIVIRMLSASTVSFSMSDLGFASSQVDLIKHCISKTSGLILFTGPTGSGKTTSLYSILKSMNANELNIVTVEDPVEYRLKNITQVEVNEAAGSGFATLLRALLRQDPDVILIGEIRDSETAQIAARAAQTGHLVFSTLHSNNALETIRRLQNLGVDNDDIASALKLVISQRLVQKQCACRGKTSCTSCLGTGVDGRIPLMEVLQISPTLQNLISQGASIRDLCNQSELKNHKSLKEIGEEFVTEGVISRKELDAAVGL